MADDKKTPNREYPKPDREHAGVVDADRIAEAFTLIDNDVAAALRKATYEALGRVVLGLASDIVTGREDVVPTAAAVKEHVAEALADLIGSTPGALDTLAGLAEALGNDPNFATTIAEQIGTKADKSAMDAAIAAINSALAQRYTKGQTDTALAAKADKAETETALAGINASLANKRDNGNAVVFGNWKIVGNNGGNVEIWNGDTRVLYLQGDGNLNTQFFGHFNNYIDGRADRAREEAKNWAYGNLIQDARQNGWAENAPGNNAWGHLPGGAVATAWHRGSAANMDALGGRYQQFQRGGNWFTEGVW